MKTKLIYVLTLIFAAASIAATQSPDLIVSSVSRVAGKNELKVTIQNQSGEPAANIILKVYALPFGFCISSHAYESDKSKIENRPCAAKTSDFATSRQLSTVDAAKNRLKLSWATASAKPFELQPGASVEQSVKFPASMRGSINADAPTVFPVPYFYENGSYLYAPKSLATFEASVFYAVVESNEESKTKTDNNAYLFKHPVVIKLPQ